MSLNTKCSECGEWFPIGAKHSVGEPCHRCKQKKAQFAAEIAATYPKPKCPVFGCTIPRGIPHEHPAGVFVVMRDPAQALTSDELAEINSFRNLQNVGFGTPAHINKMAACQAGNAFSGRDVYVVPADAKIHGGRKLTQALLEAGRSHREGHNDLAFYDESQAKWQDAPVTIDQAPAPRRSFVSLIARVAFWIVLAVTVAIWIFAGVKS